MILCQESILDFLKAKVKRWVMVNEVTPQGEQGESYAVRAFYKFCPVLDTCWLVWKVFCVPPTLETKYFVGAGRRRYRPSIQKQALFGLEKDFVCPRLETVGIKKKTKQSGSCQPTGSHYEFWNAVPTWTVTLIYHIHRLNTDLLVAITCNHH